MRGLLEPRRLPSIGPVVAAGTVAATVPPLNLRRLAHRANRGAADSRTESSRLQSCRAGAVMPAIPRPSGCRGVVWVGIAAGRCLATEVHSSARVRTIRDAVLENKRSVVRCVRFISLVRCWLRLVCRFSAWVVTPPRSRPQILARRSPVWVRRRAEAWKFQAERPASSRTVAV